MKQKLLYIERDEEDRAQLRRILMDAGYDLIMASSGRDALEKVEKYEVHLILLSLDLPDMDGFDLVRQLRRRHGNLDYRPILAVLAHTQRGDAEKAFEAGCDEYISEPINVIELCDRIAALLEARPLESEQGK